MTCPNCSSSVAEDQEFCGKCGHRIRETVASLSERLVAVETRANAREQRLLELETIENVMNGVQRRVVRFAYFAGIPLLLFGLALSLILGKDYSDLKTVAADAKKAIAPVLEEAKSVAADALSTAKDARTTSQQVSDDVRKTQRGVTELKTQVDSRIADAQKLDTQIKDLQASVVALNAKVNSQTQQVAHLTQQVKTVETNKSITEIKSLSPGVYGEHQVTDYRGFPIGAKDKSTEVRIVVALDQSISSQSPLDPAKTVAVLQTLKDHHYEVFLQGVYMLAIVPGGSSQNIAWINSETCNEMANYLNHASSRPCILYYSEAMETKVSELRTLLSPVQQFGQVYYVPLLKLPPKEQELIQKTGVDIVVVLGQN
jgi:hypothetical protein